MTPVNLHGFREIARTGGDRMVLDQGGDKVQKGSTSFFGKVAAWLCGGYTGQTKIDNQSTLTAFKNALKHSYGETIGDTAFGGLQQDFAPGKPLSAKKIKAAILRADLQVQNKHAVNNLRISTHAHTKLNEVFQADKGGELTAILGTDQAQELRNLVEKNLRALPEFSREVLTQTKMEEVIQSSIQQFYGLKQDQFEAQFPSLAPVAQGDGIHTMSLANVLSSGIAEVGETKPGMALAMESSSHVLGDTLELLGQCPVSQEEIQSFRTSVQTQKEALAHLKLAIQGDGPQAELRTGLIAEIDDQIARLDSKMQHLALIGDAVPTSEKAVAGARKLWVESAITIIDQEIARLGQGDGQVHGVEDGLQQPLLTEGDRRIETLTTLRGDLLQEMQTELDQARNGEKVEDMATRIKAFPKNLTERIKTEFKTLGISTDGLKERLSTEHLRQLNEEQNWTTVTRELQFVGGDGAAHKFSSEIKPACKLGNVFDDMGTTGVSCASFTESGRTVNLCRTSLQDDSGTEIFGALRHGVHSAFGISDPGERRTANVNRAMDSLKAALLMKPGLLTQALAGQTVDLDISSISLLTTDNARSIINSKHSNEKAQWSDQLAVWQHLSNPANHPIVLQMKGTDDQMHDVRIKPDVLAFNFGLNVGAMKGLGPLPNTWDLVGGWGNVRKANSGAMEKLLGDTTPGAPLEGRVGAWLQANPGHPKAKIVAKLAEQIKSIWVDDAFMRQGHEHTKIVSRLAVLTHMMDDVAMWNCKSGKDRTGLLDVESKFLAAQIATTGDVPDPDHELTEKEKAMWREFAISSGNLEIQQMNTGLGGFKTEGVDVIHERIGGEQSSGREYYRGGSHFVKE